MIILAIETSCDETSAAVIDGDRVLSSVVWSQIKDHRRWGGVVPSVARRAHEERLPQTVASALLKAKTRLPHRSHESHGKVAAIAVTVGPGLAPALEVGVAFAKKLALENHIPLIPVNHLEGHLASVFLRRKTNLPYLPNSANLTNWISLIVSGGHTELVQSTIMMNGEFRIANGISDIQHSSFNIHNSLLGQTLDDAAGECIDKVGRELGLGYPAGPVMEKLASFSSSRANPAMREKSRDLAKRFELPIPLLRSPRNDLNFSFSGLKTAAIQTLQHTHEIKKASQRDAQQLSKRQMCDFCADFQNAIIESLLLKLKRAMAATGVKTVLLVGGVAANNQLRRRAGMMVRSLGGQFYAAPKKFTGDNAAMIGLAAQWAAARGEIKKTVEEINQVDRVPNLNFAARENDQICV